MDVQTYFSQQVDVKKIIIDLLNATKSKVILAVAWFTEEELFQTLLNLQKRNIEVELIITNHEFNKLNYKQIEDNGGFFAEIGNDDKLMHMKFCIIDYNIVISGSANWTKRAFTENNEEVTIIKNNTERANNFVAEFDRLKNISGKITKQQKKFDVAQVLKVFDLIQALINIGDTSILNQYIHKLKDVEGLDNIVKHLFEGKYEIATAEIYEFKKKFTQLVDITAIEKMQLNSQIKLFAMQIETLEITKVEIETLIEQFNHRYIIEINPLLIKIIQFKRKLYDKFKKHGVEDDTYENLEAEFNKNNEEYETEIKIDIPKLSDEDTNSIKKMYRDSVKLCHPDSLQCIFENKDEASDTFNALTEAFKHNNLDKVKYISEQLRLGKPIKDINEFEELDFLRAKFASLKHKYELLIKELRHIKSSETYIMIQSIDNWDEYFDIQKNKLNQEIIQLNKKFAK